MRVPSLGIRCPIHEPVDASWPRRRSRRETATSPTAAARCGACPTFVGAAVAVAKAARRHPPRRARRRHGGAGVGGRSDRSGLLTKLSARLAAGAVVVAGTNGKTTTSRMLADILEADGRRVVHNRSGSNLVRGVAAAFADQASLAGNPGGDIAVIETDEAAFPEIVRLVKPRVILLNNLFRDQLDRYGELEHDRRPRWSAAARPAAGDDDRRRQRRRPDAGRDHRATLPPARDHVRARRAPVHAPERCRTPPTPPSAAAAAPTSRYDALYVSHLGDWRCPRCGGRAAAARRRRARRSSSIGVEALRGDASSGGEASRSICEVGVPGLYNAYNVARRGRRRPARSASPDATIRAGAGGLPRPPSGGSSGSRCDGRTLTLALVKNPVGFNEVLRMLTDGDRPA